MVYRRAGEDTELWSIHADAKSKMSTLQRKHRQLRQEASVDDED
jgi:hypothetical protein